MPHNGAGGTMLLEEPAFGEDNKTRSWQLVIIKDPMTIFAKAEILTLMS